LGREQAAPGGPDPFLARLMVVSLGGTIAMTKSEGVGVTPQLPAEALVAALPELASFTGLETCAFRQLPSPHLTFGDLEALADLIDRQAAEGVEGVVVTQGTDTIEEAAFALDLLLSTDIPVVVTGAMRNPTVAGADGPANLLAAVQVAANPAARGRGALVVMNDEIHLARFVRKTHTVNTAAFASPQAGPVGWITEGRATFALEAVRRPPIPRSERCRDRCRVALLTLSLGDDGALIDMVREGGFSGLVVEAMGGGHATLEGAQKLALAAAQMPVVLASRAGAGPVLETSYGYAGGEIDLLSKGLVPAGWLDGLKARVLLSLLLRHTEPADVTARFRAYLDGTA
jgi:L-asparaginase